MFGIPKDSGPVQSISKVKIGLFVIVGLAAVGLKVYYIFQPQSVPTATVSATPLASISPSQSISPSLPSHALVPSPSPISSPSSLSPSPPSIPPEFNLAVPFTSQAPLGEWDSVHEETCEEASLLMATLFVNDSSVAHVDPAFADQSMLAMVHLQKNTFGYGPSISLAQLKRMAEAWLVANTDDFGIVPNIEIVENPTVEGIKAFLASGKPVILPLRGREIGNPFFTGEGPLYHMLVVRGYTQDMFITNDPGTRHGQNYSYPIDVIMSAIGDWDGDSPDGGARMMVVSK